MFHCVKVQVVREETSSNSEQKRITSSSFIVLRLKQFEWSTLIRLMNHTVFSYLLLQNNTGGQILRTFQAAVVILHEQRWDPSSLLICKRCQYPQVPGADEEKQNRVTSKDCHPIWLVQRNDLITWLWWWCNPPLPQGTRDSTDLTDQGEDGEDTKQTSPCIISHSDSNLFALILNLL